MLEHIFLNWTVSQLINQFHMQLRIFFFTKTLSEPKSYTQIKFLIQSQTRERFQFT